MAAMDLIFITDDPTRARIAQAAGVDRLMVDLEILGKEARQGHLNTVISRHEPGDISALRTVLDRAELMVRVNPLHEGTQAEIDDAITRGADRLMLPMFTTAGEVARFLSLTAGRVRTSLLLETPAALARLGEILDVPGVEEVHIGLNDLHLGLGLDFMFELLSGGLVAHCADILRARGIKFGFGGVARLDTGMLPANLILAEHHRLGSTQAILSRDFWTIFEEARDEADATARLGTEIGKIRAFWARQANVTAEASAKDQADLAAHVRTIAAKIHAAKA